VKIKIEHYNGQSYLIRPLGGYGVAVCRKVVGKLFKEAGLDLGKLPKRGMVVELRLAEVRGKK